SIKIRLSFEELCNKLPYSHEEGAPSQASNWLEPRGAWKYPHSGSPSSFKKADSLTVPSVEPVLDYPFPVTIVVKDPSLVSDFSHPSLDLLGSAFVEGRLELEGSISEVMRVCDELTAALVDEDDGVVPVRTEHDKETDAKSISYHYDLSNAFYQLWLDKEMVYSCAYFKTGNETLEQAQRDKFDHLCRKL
nr:hypothetical protein [Tanacetum cinerariifolium]